MMDKIKELWKAQMSLHGHKFFVIKAEDLFESLTEDELLDFNDMLGTYNTFREPKPINEYYVVNKDDVTHIKSQEEFFKIVGYEPKDTGN